MKKNKKSISVIIILLGLVLIGTGLFLFFGTDLFKKEDKTNNGNKGSKTVTTSAEQFVGIYANKNDKLYIRVLKDNEIHYMISGNFDGFAKIEGDSAKEKSYFEDDIYNEFKLVDGGIEFIYHAPEDHEIACETGIYKKVAEYTKDNIYKEAVGDPSLLSSKYSGVFKNGEIELYVYQINEKEVKVDATGDVLFSETFEIVNDNKLVAKDFFDENKNAFEITFNDKQFSLTVNEEVFGFNEDDKKYELTYNFEQSLTPEEIINALYNRY